MPPPHLSSPMTLTAPPANVAIIGAGLAGLSLALALHQLGIPSTVYEARREDHHEGGGLMLSPNGLRALDSIGLYERVRDRALQFDKLHFKNDRDETTDIYYFGSKAMYGYEAVRVMRSDLLDELTAKARESSIPIHYDSTLATVTTTSLEDDGAVSFTFTNGQTSSASLLVGADGIQSAVRSTLAPEAKPQYAGILGINCIVQRSQLRIPDNYGLPAIAMAKPGGFLLVPQRPDGSELYIGAQRRYPELDDVGWSKLRKNKSQLYDMLREEMTHWPDIVQSALEAMPLDKMGLWAFHSLPRLSSWLSESGRVILVGDAAHAIPPTVGQGANQALEDIRSLATLLSMLSPDAPLDKVATLWQSYREKRIATILDLTQQMNAKRLPESEKAKLAPGAIWTDSSLTRGEGGELRWLYEPDLAREAEKWIEELKTQSKDQAQ